MIGTRELRRYRERTRTGKFLRGNRNRMRWLFARTEQLFIQISSISRNDVCDEMFPRRNDEFAGGFWIRLPAKMRN